MLEDLSIEDEADWDGVLQVSDDDDADDDAQLLLMKMPRPRPR